MGLSLTLRDKISSAEDLEKGGEPKMVQKKQCHHLYSRLDYTLRKRSIILELKFSTRSMNATKKLNKAATIRGILKSLAINVIPAYILFLACKNILRTSDLAAVLLSGVPAALSTLVGIARQRRVDLSSAITLIALALGIALPLFSGNPRLYFLRHSLVTLILGIAFLVSLFFPKPLWFYIGRYFLTGDDPHNIAQFNTQWQYPYFRTAMRVMTLFWGAFNLIFLAIYVPLVFILPLSFLLFIQSIAGMLFWLILLGWTTFYIRRILQRLDGRKKDSNDMSSNKPDEK